MTHFYNGFTINTDRKPIKSGFAIAPYKGVIVELSKINESDIVSFIAKNSNLLAKEGHCIGGWQNSDSGKSYLDVAVVRENKNDAIREALETGQIAIYDLANNKELNIEHLCTRPFINHNNK